MNQDHSAIFEIWPKYSISDSLADYLGYSISYKQFLPMVVDVMVIWINYTHSSSRDSLDLMCDRDPWNINARSGRTIKLVK